MTEAGALLVAHADAVADRLDADRIVEVVLRPETRHVPAVVALLTAVREATG